MYERDVTGAAGSILSFSDAVITSPIVDAETVEIVIPSQYARYVAEFSAYPKTLATNNIAIKWSYYPKISMISDPDAPSFVTTGERVMKYVAGGSRIDVSKVRASLIPPVAEPEMVINITLYAEV